MELTRRPARTVQSKRKYLGDFVGLIGKKFADEYRREDVLKYKNKLQDDGFEPKTIDTRMMAVVTFFNRWLKIKLGLDAKDWPETHDNDPEPYTDDEAAKLETASAGEINLLIRTFRQTGCRDMELAHLNDTDLLDSEEIFIREKPCSDCKDCRSRGNVWRPKTPKSTRKIPVSDALFSELKERGKANAITAAAKTDSRARGQEAHMSDARGKVGGRAGRREGQGGTGEAREAPTA